MAAVTLALSENTINRDEFKKKTSKIYEELISVRDKKKLNDPIKIKKTIERF